MSRCLPYETRLRIYEQEKRKLWGEMARSQSPTAYDEYEDKHRELVERLGI